MADKELLPDPSGARNLSLDDLFKLHTTVCTWTSNADTKTSYGLVFAAVLLGIIIKKVEEIQDMIFGTYPAHALPGLSTGPQNGLSEPLSHWQSPVP